MRSRESKGQLWLIVGCIALSSGSWISAGEHRRFNFDDLLLGSIPPGCLIAETGEKGQAAVWQVIEIEDAPSGKQAFALTESSNTGHIYNLALAQDSYFKDIEVSVKLKPLSGQEDQGGGLAWRVHDPNNYYAARWNPLENNFRVYVVQNGERRQLASIDVQVDPSDWHEIEIEMEGNEIEATFDSEFEIEIEDSTLSLAGMVGLWTKADAATAFDDFEVEIGDDADEDEDDDDENEKE